MDNSLHYLGKISNEPNLPGEEATEVGNIPSVILANYLCKVAQLRPVSG